MEGAISSGRLRPGRCLLALGAAGLHAAPEVTCTAVFDASVGAPTSATIVH